MYDTKWTQNNKQESPRKVIANKNPNHLVQCLRAAVPRVAGLHQKTKITTKTNPKRHISKNRPGPATARRRATRSSAAPRHGVRSAAPPPPSPPAPPAPRDAGCPAPACVLRGVCWCCIYCVLGFLKGEEWDHRCPAPEAAVLGIGHGVAAWLFWWFVACFGDGVAIFPRTQQSHRTGLSGAREVGGRAQKQVEKQRKSGLNEEEDLRQHLVHGPSNTCARDHVKTVKLVDIRVRKCKETNLRQEHWRKHLVHNHNKG